MNGVAMCIQAELRKRPQWVCWRQERRGDKLTKVPINSRSGALAKTNDASTWSSFEAALAAVEHLNCDGVGFVFARQDPYVGVDLEAAAVEATQAQLAQVRP